MKIKRIINQEHTTKSSIFGISFLSKREILTFDDQGNLCQIELPKYFGGADQECLFKGSDIGKVCDIQIFNHCVTHFNTFRVSEEVIRRQIIAFCYMPSLACEGGRGGKGCTEQCDQSPFMCLTERVGFHTRVEHTEGSNPRV